MQFKTRIIIPLLILILAGCSMLPNEMKSAEELMEKSPDSALHLLQKIKPNHTFSNDEQALYGLLLFEALDKNYLPLQPDSVINYSLDYYQSKNDKPRLAKCYFYKGRMYKYAQRYDEATEFYLKALDNCNEERENTLKGKIFYDLGEICVWQSDYKEAREKFQKSFDYFNLDKQYILASYRILDIGKTYYETKDYITSQKYYNLAISKTNDSTLNGDIFQELGINYLALNKYDSSEMYIRKSLEFPTNKVGLGIRYYKFAELFFSMEKYDSAYLYANKSLEYPITFNTKRECYRLLANTSYNIGNIKLVGEYIRNFQNCTDSVRKIESQTKTTILENIHETTKNVGKTKDYILILSWIIPLIILISSLTFFRLKKRNTKKEIQLIQVEKKLSEKQTTLKKSIIQKIEDIKAHQLPEYRQSNLAKREQMDKDAYYSSLHLNDWKFFLRNDE